MILAILAYLNVRDLLNRLHRPVRWYHEPFLALGDGGIGALYRLKFAYDSTGSTKR